MILPSTTGINVANSGSRDIDNKPAKQMEGRRTVSGRIVDSYCCVDFRIVSRNAVRSIKRQEQGIPQ
jgi:type II secretory pathway predicted ATPase ExeA